MSFFYNSKIFPFSHSRKEPHRSFMRLLHRVKPLHPSSTIYCARQSTPKLVCPGNTGKLVKYLRMLAILGIAQLG